MTIDYTNRHLINDKINIHDSIFEGFIYREKEKLLLIELKNYSLNTTYNLNFYNVIAVNCEMCQFWGKSPNILDWQVCDNENLMQAIVNKQNSNKDLYKNSLINTKKSYLETVITLTSGDTINIVCEHIDIKRLQLHKE